MKLTFLDLKFLQSALKSWQLLPFLFFHNAFQRFIIQRIEVISLFSSSILQFSPFHQNNGEENLMNKYGKLINSVRFMISWRLA